jgi:hypothetical protein
MARASGIDVRIVTANVPKPPPTSLPLSVETKLLSQRREEATGRVDCGRELENDRTFKQAVGGSDRVPSLKTVGLLKLTSRSSTVLKTKLTVPVFAPVLFTPMVGVGRTGRQTRGQ